MALDVFHVLGLGVGVIETQMADAAILLGYAEIEADRLGVADVQKPFGSGGKRVTTRPS